MLACDALSLVLSEDTWAAPIEPAEMLNSVFPCRLQIFSEVVLQKTLQHIPECAVEPRLCECLLMSLNRQDKSSSKNLERQQKGRFCTGQTQERAAKLRMLSGFQGMLLMKK